MLLADRIGICIKIKNRKTGKKPVANGLPKDTLKVGSINSLWQILDLFSRITDERASGEPSLLELYRARRRKARQIVS